MLGEAERYEQGYQETVVMVPEAAYPWVAASRAEKFQPFVQASDRVFEYGVGPGWNLAKLKCAQRIGCDISAYVAPIASAQGIEFLPDSGGIADRSMDVVICHHVLEHVHHPQQLLAECHRILRHDGKILLYVPYERERRHRRYDPNEPNHHLFSWTPQTLGNFIADCGFKVLSAGLSPLYGYGYDRFSAIWAYKLNLGEHGFRLIRLIARLLRPAREVVIVASVGQITS